MTSYRRRPILALGVALAMALVLACTTPPPEPASQTHPPAWVGMWVVSQSQWEQVYPGARVPTRFWGLWPFQTGGTAWPASPRVSMAPFRFDGKYAYLQGLRWKAWEAWPDDDILRLPANWKGNDLYCLWPNGSWYRLAAFRDGHFEVGEEGTRWVLERAGPADLGPYDRPFLKKGRPVWDYPHLTARRFPLRMTLAWAGEPEGGGRPVGPARVLREDPRRFFKLDGVPTSITGLAYRPGSDWLAAAGLFADGDGDSNRGYVKLWDTATGRPEGTLAGLPAGVWGLAFSHDGRRLALACEDRTVRVWDAAGCRELLALSGHVASVTAVAFSADGTLLASADRGGRVIVWDAMNGRQRQSFAADAESVSPVAFGPDGRSVLSACWREGMKVWDVATGVEKHRLPMSPRWCTVAFHPDGKRVAVGGWDGVAVWDVTAGRPLVRLSRDEGRIVSIAWSRDGRYIASGGERGDVKFWDTVTGGLVFTIRGYGGPVKCLAFSGDGRCLASSGRPETTEVWGLADILAKRPDAR